MEQNRIHVVGDSISLQYGPFLQRALGPAFHYTRKGGEEEALLDLDVPRGSNGGDSAMVREYLERLADGGRFHVDVLLINCGLHDIKTDPASAARQVEPDAYRENLAAIIALAARLAGQTIWIETTPVDDTLHARRKTNFGRVQADVVLYNAIAAEVMTERAIPILDLGRFTATLGSGAAIFRDGVHFVEPVQQQQAAYIAGWLGARFSVAPVVAHKRGQ